MSLIVIATGGSGGHIFPAINVAKELEAQGHKTVFMGRFSSFIDEIRNHGFVYEEINVRGFNSGKIKDVFSTFFLMIKGFFVSLKLLRKIKPDLVIGFGSYSSAPVVLASIVCQCRSIIHEQNVVPGKANKFLSLFAKKIAVSFKQSEKYWPKNKVLLTGCPISIKPSQVPVRDILKKF